MFYSFKLLLIALVTLPVSLVIVLLGFFDTEGKLAYEGARFWTWAVLKIGAVHLNIKGLDHLDPSRPYIFMANHQSNIDIPALVQSLSKFQLRWVAKKELLRVPFFGWALWSSKHIVVDRLSREQAMASFRKARGKITSGLSVVFFPEGTRSSGAEMLPFKKGGFLLAMKTHTAIVPITINGSGNILPKGDWRIRKGEIEIIVSEPVSVHESRLRDIPSLMARVRRLIRANSRQEAGITVGNSLRMQAPAQKRCSSDTAWNH